MAMMAIAFKSFLLLTVLLLVSLLLRNTAVEGFAPGAISCHRSHNNNNNHPAAAKTNCATELSAVTAVGASRRQVWTMVGSALLGSAALVLVASAPAAHAQVIKELDMSLPNYAEVKSPTASVETAKSLYIDKAPQGGTNTNAPTGLAAIFGTKRDEGDNNKNNNNKKQSKPKEKTDAQGYILFLNENSCLLPAAASVYFVVYM